jgi:hypothetical protein
MAIRINGTDRPSTINQPTNTPMGTYHLAANTNLFEIQRSNNFEFIVTDIDGIQRAGMIGGEAQSTFPNAQEILRLSVSASSVPHFTQDAIVVSRGNSKMKFAGVPTFNEGEIKVVDYIGASAKEVLMAWQNLSYNVLTDKVGLASDYKKDCYLVEYTPDYQKVRQYKMHGCWIGDLTEDSYDHEGNEKRLVTCKIHYDRAEIDTSEVV